MFLLWTPSSVPLRLKNGAAVTARAQLETHSSALWMRKRGEAQRFRTGVVGEVGTVRLRSPGVESPDHMHVPLLGHSLQQLAGWSHQRLHALKGALAAASVESLLLPQYGRG